VINLAQQLVAEVPIVVRREVDCIGPVAISGVTGVILDDVVDGDVVAYRCAGWQGDAVDHQIGRWWRLNDEHA
jgi:hypothetical protein